MTNSFLEYKEELYSELAQFHIWNTETYTEIMKLLEARQVKTIEGMMKILFDYAFKCGIKRSLNLLEAKETSPLKRFITE